MKTVDIVIATPSMLAPHNPVDNPTIKVVAVAGEPCPKCKSINTNIDKDATPLD